MAKPQRYTAPANPVRNQAMIELRRSGAAGSHADRRERRARSRAAMLTREISYEHCVAKVPRTGFTSKRTNRTCDTAGASGQGSCVPALLPSLGKSRVM